jgi:hypothetical protein
MSNIFRITTESHLSEFLANHKQSITTIIFLYNDDKNIKELLKQMAKQYTMSFFLLVEVQRKNAPINPAIKFVADTGHFIKQLENFELPVSFIYFNNNLCVTIPNQQELNNTYLYIKSKVDSILSSPTPASAPAPDNAIAEQQKLMEEKLHRQAIIEQQLDQHKKLRQKYELEQLQKYQHRKELQEEKDEESRELKEKEQEQKAKENEKRTEKEKEKNRDKDAKKKSRKA